MTKLLTFYLPCLIFLKVNSLNTAAPDRKNPLFYNDSFSVNIKKKSGFAFRGKFQEKHFFVVGRAYC